MVHAKHAHTAGSSRPRFRTRPRARTVTSLLLAGALIGAGSAGMTSANAAASQPAQVQLRTAAPFAVLAGSTVTSTGPTVINGDLGVSPGTSVTGFPPGVVNGTVHVGDGVAAAAQADLGTAYTGAAGRPSDADLTGQDLGGLTLTAGVRTFGSTAALNGTLTLDAEGNPDAVFIFQVGTALDAGTHSQVVLTDGAQACRVFWTVGSSATLGVASQFAGTVLAQTSITATTGATVDGRLLAQNGAVTLDSNTVTQSACAANSVPNLTVSTTADPTSRPAPGGSFTYTVDVTNAGTEGATLTRLFDDIYGNLNGRGSCDTGALIAVGATYTCTFSGTFTGKAGSSQTNTATATGTDASGDTGTASDSATVTLTTADATGYLEICKKADNSNGRVSGSYDFAVAGRTVTVPVGTCTGPLKVPAGEVTVTEAAKTGVRMNACATWPTVSLLNCSPADRTAVVRVRQGGVAEEVMLTVTNRLRGTSDTGAIKVCKVAGAGVRVGTGFTFAVGGRTVTVPAGPADQGGYCKLVYGFTRGTSVPVTEAATAGTHVARILVQPTDRRISGSTDRRTVSVRITPGITVTTFTNTAS